MKIKQTGGDIGSWVDSEVSGSLRIFIVAFLLFIATTAVIFKSLLNLT